ncbi:MAG TPA: hypothetical protein VF753_00080 [Terriglobales bacterium]
MRIFAFALLVSSFVFNLAAVAPAADQTGLTFKYSKVEIPGALENIPYGINNAGVIVGEYQDSTGLYHGYILQGSNVTTLDDSNGDHTAAEGINPNGTITVVGCYSDSSGITRGFLYTAGAYTDVPGPTGAASSCAMGINDSGVISGYYSNSSGHIRGFMLNNGVYSTLTDPDASTTIGQGINDSNNVAAWWIKKENSRVNSSVYQPSKKNFTFADVPGSNGTYAWGIDTAGDIAAWWLDGDGIAHGALRINGTYHKFDYPHDPTYVYGINDYSTVVGAYLSSTGAYFGFRATYK